MKSSTFLTRILFAAAFGVSAAAHGEITGLPASDVLGSEDLWENPTFIGGVVNGGPSASTHY